MPPQTGFCSNGPLVTCPICTQDLERVQAGDLGVGSQPMWVSLYKF